LRRDVAEISLYARATKKSAHNEVILPHHWASKCYGSTFRRRDIDVRGRILDLTNPQRLPCNIRLSHQQRPRSPPWVGATAGPARHIAKRIEPRHPGGRPHLPVQATQCAVGIIKLAARDHAPPVCDAKRRGRRDRRHHRAGGGRQHGRRTLEVAIRLSGRQATIALIRLPGRRSPGMVDQARQNRRSAPAAGFPARAAPKSLWRSRAPPLRRTQIGEPIEIGCWC
jgi:hypothetical protein